MLRTAAAAALLSLCLTACSEEPPASLIPAESDTSIPHTDHDSEWKQTWPKEYAITTCRDYTEKMTLRERQVFAGDMLKALRNSYDYPIKEEAAHFRREIWKVCTPAPKQTIVDMAVGVWTTVPGFD